MSKIHWLPPLKCGYLLVFFISYETKLCIFGFWIQTLSAIKEIWTFWLLRHHNSWRGELVQRRYVAAHVWCKGGLQSFSVTLNSLAQFQILCRVTVRRVNLWARWDCSTISAYITHGRWLDVWVEPLGGVNPPLRGRLYINKGYYINIKKTKHDSFSH